MKESTNKIQSEFEQKLRQSESAPDNMKPVVNEPDKADANTRATEQPKTIPVVEEQVRVNKKTVETGSVHIYKDVHEEEVTVDVPAVHEEVNVERIPRDEYVDSPPSVRHEGDVMVIPVLKEEIVVTKRLKLVEELHVTKRKKETQEQQQITLRREEVKVNRVDLDKENPDRA